MTNVHILARMCMCSISMHAPKKSTHTVIDMFTCAQCYFSDVSLLTMLLGTGDSKDILSITGCLLCFTARVSVNSGRTVENA